jgi:hypothetical protein
MSPVLTIKKLFMCLALILASAIVADPIKAQPVGGPTTGGNDPTGGNTTGGNTTGGNTGGGNVNTGGNVGVNVGEERRYIVEFDNFIVLDETGCDSCGSDEPQFIIRTADYALVTSEYDEADSGYQPWPFDDTSPIPYEFKRCAVPPAMSTSITIIIGNAIGTEKPPRCPLRSPHGRMTAIYHLPAFALKI